MNKWFACFWLLFSLLPFHSKANWITLEEMFLMAEMSKKEQNDFLKKRNYFPQREDYSAEGALFGNDWKNSERDDYFQILWKDGIFRKFEYRLLDDIEAFDALRRFPAAYGFKKHSLCMSKYDTESRSFVNKEFALTLVRFPNKSSKNTDSEWFYQFHLTKLDYFYSDYLPWLLKNKRDYEEYE